MRTTNRGRRGKAILLGGRAPAHKLPATAGRGRPAMGWQILTPTFTLSNPRREPSGAPNIDKDPTRP